VPRTGGREGHKVRKIGVGENRPERLVQGHIATVLGESTLGGSLRHIRDCVPEGMGTCHERTSCSDFRQAGMADRSRSVNLKPAHRE
jgi:hypothetical protein